MPGASTRADPWTRTVAVDLQTSLGGPYGLLGASVEVAPVSFFTLSVGGGWSGAPTVAVVPRLRYAAPAHRLAFSVGSGISYGTRTDDDGSCFGPICGVDPSRVGTYRVIQLRIEGSLEYRWPNGVELRGYAGWADVVWAAESSCSAFPATCPSAQDETGRQFAYVGVALGYALGF